MKATTLKCQNLEFKTIDLYGTLPKIRQGHRIVCISPNEFLLFGGRGKRYKALGDLWKFKYNKSKFEIKQFNSKGPCNRSGHSMLFLPSRNSVLVMFGRTDGYKDENYPSDIWEFEINKNIWKEHKISKLPKLNSHKTILYRNRFVCFICGRDEFGEKKSILVMDIDDGYKVSRWDCLEQNKMNPRKAVVAIHSDHQIIIFGGQSNSRSFSGGIKGHNDVWCFDLLSKKMREWKTIGISPLPRNGAQFTQINGKLYIFGGSLDFDSFRDFQLHELDLNLRSWKQYRTIGGVCMCFGGSCVLNLNIPESKSKSVEEDKENELKENWIIYGGVFDDGFVSNSTIYFLELPRSSQGCSNRRFSILLRNDMNFVDCVIHHYHCSTVLKN